MTTAMLIDCRIKVHSPEQFELQMDEMVSKTERRPISRHFFHPSEADKIMQETFVSALTCDPDDWPMFLVHFELAPPVVKERRWSNLWGWIG